MRFIGYSFTPLGLELGYQHWMLLSDRYRAKCRSVVMLSGGEQAILDAIALVDVGGYREATIP